MKKNIKLILLLTIGLLSIAQDLAASHIIGGNIQYRYIGNDNYEITFVMRRDCITGAPDAQFDNPADIYFYKSNGALASVGQGLAGKLEMNFNPDDTLGNTFISDCGFEGTQVCIQETQYRDTIKLGFLEGGYIISYQRCCRNPTIQNILEPDNTGATWWTLLSEEALLANNSTPVLGEWPAIYICAGEPIDFSFTAEDIDGDSLSYSLYTPYAGGDTTNAGGTIVTRKPPYSQLSWNGVAGFSEDNVFSSDVPLTVDPITGEFNGIPQFEGQYLAGVVVNEYRDGVLLSSTRRDFQYNVRVCSEPPTADFMANGGNCEGIAVQFENMTISASDFLWNFNYPSTDPAFISTEENPLFEYSETGVYQVRLLATRGSDDCKSEIIKSVSALFSEIDVVYDLSIQSCNADGGYTIRLTDESTEAEVGFDITGREWTFTQNGFDVMFTEPVVTIDVLNQDFVVKLSVTSGTGCSKSVTDSINIDDLFHETDFTIDLTGCSDEDTATITLTDISDGLNPYDTPTVSNWSVTTSDGVLTSQENPFVLDVADTGNITVNLMTNFGGSCQATIEKDFDLEEIVPQTSYTYVPIGCPEDETVELIFSIGPDSENPNYDVTAIEWSITAGGMGQSSIDELITVIVPKDSLVTVELTTTFDNGCIDKITDTFIPGPFATIDFVQDSPVVVCIGDTIQLVAGGNPDFTYSWSTDEGLVFDGTWSPSNPGLIGIADGSYTVTVSDGLCSVEETISVEVFDGNNLAIAGDSITCDGSVALTATGGLLEGEFIWALDPSFTDVIFTGETLNTVFTGDSETYYVAFTGESCDDPFAEFTVYLSEVFNIAFNGDPVRSCLGDTVQLLANYNPDLTYTWSPTDDLVFFNGNNSDAYVAATADMTYNVNVAGEFCDFDTLVNLEISDIQELLIQGDSVICTDTVKLFVSGAIGNGNYEWSTEPDFSIILSDADTLERVLEDANEIFYVRFTDPTCGNEVFDYSVRLYDFDLDYLDQWIICPGDTVQFPLFNNGEQDVTYVWETDVHIVNGTNNDMSPLIGTASDENDPFVIYFTATSSFGCVVNDSIEVLFTENPDVDISFELQECGEFTVCFDIIGEYGGFPSWDFGDPTVTTDISIDQATCYTYPNPGVFEVILSNLANTCAFVSDTVLVTINDEINIDPIDEQIACLGAEVEVTATSPDSNITFVWCTLDGDTIVEGADVTVVADSSYQIIVKATDPNGCSNQETVDISIVEFDIVDNIEEVLCDGQETNIELTVNGNNDNYTFEWSPADCILSGGDTANPIVIASGDKTLAVVITEIATGCATLMEYEVSTTSFTVEAAAEPDTINPGDPTLIFVVEQFDEYTYEWDNENTDGEQTVTPEESTTYTVTVTDDLGCTATADVFVFVREPVCDETDVFIPTAFTPNGDNSNDVLYVRSNFLDELELIVFNRWGEEVFRTVDINAGWDGTYKGEELQPDVFAYYFKAKCINGITYSKSGNVSLLK